jgi:hypothetical protein
MESGETDMEIVSIDKLLAPTALPEDNVEIAGVGWVKVRGLSRGEMHLLTKKDGGNPSTRTADLFYLAHGLVEPKITEAHAEKLMDNIGFGSLQAVISKISELSGVDRTAQKEAYKSLRS